MTKEILVVNAERDKLSALCEVLQRAGFVTTAATTVDQSQKYLSARSRPVVVIDIDTPAIDNRTIRELKGWNPEAIIVALSHRRHHPELVESMQRDLFACLSKPVDPGELKYLLRDDTDAVS